MSNIYYRKGLPKRPYSTDDREKSFRAIVATDSVIKRIDKNQEFNEIQSIGGIEFPPSGRVTLLDSHKSDTVTSVVGSAQNFIRKLYEKPCALECDIFFSSTKKGLAAFQNVKEGHLTDCSIGYKIIDFEWLEAGLTKDVNGITYGKYNYRVKIIKKSLLTEVSLTILGADPRAVVLKV
jgi:phage head maturation protease